MTDRERATAAYNKIMSELFRFDRCPTYALAKITLENMTSKGDVFLMEEYRFIRYIGLNSNGFETYQVRASEDAKDINNNEKESNTMNTNNTNSNKKSISVSNLTLGLYLDYVRPAALKAGLLEDAVTEEGRPYYITDEAIAKEIESDMRCACFNAGNDGVRRTHEEYIAHEAEQMLYQIEISIKYCKDGKVVEALEALRNAMTDTDNSTEETKGDNTMTTTDIITDIIKAVDQTKTRSAWQRGVKAYALEMLEEMAFNARHGYLDSDAFSNRKMLKNALLNGADDWNAYSWGGCALIYDGDIAERLCTPSELKKTKNGERKPNSSEEWLDTQARALSQACGLILDQSCVPSFRSWEAAQATRAEA